MLRPKSFQIIFSAALMLCTAAAVLSQERYLKPVDEGKNDASLVAFRQKLLTAVRNKDAKYVLSIVDPQIKNSFGDSNGLAEFKKWWKLNDAKSEFWAAMLPVIGNGGLFTKDTKVKNTEFWAPYTFLAFPADLDAFDYSAIFGNNVNLREAPTADSKILGSLSYNIVKLIEGGAVMHENDTGNETWLKVETFGGKKGFVRSDFVRSSVDHRACFEKIKGSWKMTVFIAGD